MLRVNIISYFTLLPAIAFSAAQGGARGVGGCPAGGLPGAGVSFWRDLGSFTCRVRRTTTVSTVRGEAVGSIRYRAGTGFEYCYRVPRRFRFICTDSAITGVDGSTGRGYLVPGTDTASFRRIRGGAHLLEPLFDIVHHAADFAIAGSHGRYRYYRRSEDRTYVRTGRDTGRIDVIEKFDPGGRCVFQFRLHYENPETEHFFPAAIVIRAGRGGIAVVDSLLFDGIRLDAAIPDRAFLPRRDVRLERFEPPPLHEFHSHGGDRVP